MTLRIRVSGTGSTTIRIDRATRIVVDASGGLTIDIGDGPDRVSITTGSRTRDRRDALLGARGIAGLGTVTPAMEAAAVRAFLGAADATRLGRSLSEVYSAMDAVRRDQDGPGDDGDET